MQVLKRAITRDATKQLGRAMKTWLVLLSLSTAASTAYAQNDTTMTVIREGVQIVICFPDSTKRVDTMSITEFIESQPKDEQQRNRNLRQLNEMMKKEPEWKPKQ